MSNTTILRSSSTDSFFKILHCSSITTEEGGDPLLCNVSYAKEKDSRKPTGVASPQDAMLECTTQPVHSSSCSKEQRRSQSICIGSFSRVIPPVESIPAHAINTITTPAKRLINPHRSWESYRRKLRTTRPKRQFVIWKEKEKRCKDTKEMWKMQRDRALHDRHIFFGGEQVYRDLWRKRREKTLQDRRIFFLED